MIVLYAGKDERVLVGATDAAGTAIDLSTHPGVLRIQSLGDYAVTPLAVGEGYATVPDTDTVDLAGFGRYWVLVDDTVTEEGVCIIRPIETLTP